MDKFVELTRVGKHFETRKGRFVALREVNLDIARGEFVSLIGHSGCGKSTVLNLIAGLLEPSEGGLICNGREIDGPGPERAVVFQNHSLLPWMTCLATCSWPSTRCSPAGARPSAGNAARRPCAWSAWTTRCTNTPARFPAA